MLIFWLGILFTLILGYLIYVSNKQERGQAAFHYIVRATNDGDDEIDIMLNLMQRYNMTPELAHQAIFEAKAGNEDWFKQNVK